MKYYYFLDEVSSSTFFLEEGIDKLKIDVFRRINNINTDTYVGLVELDSTTPTFKNMKLINVDGKKIYYNIGNLKIDNVLNIVDIKLSKSASNIESDTSRFITYENIIKMCSDVPYVGEGLEKTEEEHLPTMATIYYYYTSMCNKVLTPYQFMRYYISTYFEYIDSDTVALKPQHRTNYSKQTYSLRGLYSRMWRAFGSFNRELTIFCLIKESSMFEDVKYSLVTDTKDGIDITVCKESEEFYLRIADNTVRSNEFLDKKSNKREYDYKRTINLLAGVFTDKNMTKINGWKLYNAINVSRLIEKIEEKIINL